MKNLFTILLVVMALLLTIGMFSSFAGNKAENPTDIPDVNDNVETPGNTEQPEVDEHGYEITFSDIFFDDLEAANVSLYVDGKQVTEAPENNTMRGIVVELKGIDVNTYYRMDITPYNDVMPYASTVGGEFCGLGEFNMPLCLVLLDSVRFDRVGIKGTF